MINKVHNEDCLETMKKIKDKSINLIIADFPYFEVKGDFDFIWKDFNDFLEWVEVCAKEFKRILADNGSLYVYGHAKKIAYKQIIFDKYFNIENHIVWEKLQCQTKKGIEEFRSYAPIKEHILFYSNEMKECDNDKTKRTEFAPIKEYMREQRRLCGMSSSELKTFCNLKGNLKLIGFYFGDSQWQLPVKENYLKMQKTGYWQKSYEALRKEYEHLRRPFNNKYRLEDVMKFDQEANITGKYDHPTQKPPKLSRALIETSTNKDSLVYIPFGGSGVEVEQCQILGLDWITSELEPKYCEIIEDRIKNAKGEVGLFSADLVQKTLF